MSTDSILVSRERNTGEHDFLRVNVSASSVPFMVKKLTPWGLLLAAAAKGYPKMWRDGRLNLSAVARHYERKGMPVTQPVLYRNCYPMPDGRIQFPAEETIQATAHVFGIPTELQRGEALPRRLEDLLTKWPLDVLLLAERITRLQDDDREDILRWVGRAEERTDGLKAMVDQQSNVTPITKHKKQ